jgi:hypothetical protein
MNSAQPRPRFPLRDLTPEEHNRYYDHYRYVKYEEYPPEHRGSGAVVGQFWTEEMLRLSGYNGENKHQIDRLVDQLLIAEEMQKK